MTDQHGSCRPDHPAEVVFVGLLHGDLPGEGTHLAQPPLQGYGVPSLKGHLHTLLEPFCVRDTQDNPFQLTELEFPHLKSDRNE